MNLDLSPFTRRLLAVTLLAIAVLAAVNLVVVPLAAALGTTLGELHDARFRTGRLAALAARPPLGRGDPVDPACCIDGQAAAAALNLRALVAAAAATSHVTLGRMVPVAPDPRTPDVVAVDLVASGDDAAMMTFVAAIEQGRPVLRLTRWRLALAEPDVSAAAPPTLAASAATSTAAVHLDARIAAVIRPAR